MLSFFSFLCCYFLLLVVICNYLDFNFYSLNFFPSCVLYQKVNSFIHLVFVFCGCVCVNALYLFLTHSLSLYILIYLAVIIVICVYIYFIYFLYLYSTCFFILFISTYVAKFVDCFICE